MGMFDLGGTSLSPTSRVEVEKLDATAAAATQKTKDISTDSGEIRGGGDGLYVPPAEREEIVAPVDDLDAIVSKAPEVIDQQEALDEIVEDPIEENIAEKLPEEVGGYGEIMTTMVDSEFLSADQEKEYTADVLGMQELIRDNIEAGRSGYHKVEELPDEVQGYLKAKTLDENLNFTEYIDNEVFEEDYTRADPANEGHQASLLTEWGKSRGDSAEDIRIDIETYRANGTIGKRSSTAKSQLIRAQEGRLNDKAEAFEAANLVRANQEKSEVAKFTADVMAMTEVNGIKLSQADKISIVAYETVKVGPKGQTQAQLDTSLESRVFSSYAMKNKLDMTKVDRKATTKSNIKLQKTLRLKGDPVARRKSSAAKPIPKSNQDISAIKWRKY